MNIIRIEAESMSWKHKWQHGTSQTIFSRRSTVSSRHFYDIGPNDVIKAYPTVNLSILYPDTLFHYFYQNPDPKQRHNTVDSTLTYYPGTTQQAYSAASGRLLQLGHRMPTSKQSVQLTGIFFLTSSTHRKTSRYYEDVMIQAY